MTISTTLSVIKLLFSLIFINFFDTHDAIDIIQSCPIRNNRISGLAEQTIPYKFIDLLTNDRITIECCAKYPTSKKSSYIWYRQDRSDPTSINEVVFSENPSVYLTNNNLELIIENITSDQNGAYFCKSPWNPDENEVIRYLIDVLDEVPSLIRGKMRDIIEFQKKHLYPANQFLQHTPMDQKSRFGIVFSVYLEWMMWTPCDGCTSTKYREGRCRFTVEMSDPGVCKKLRTCRRAEIFIQITNNLACRSKELQKLLPKISARIKTIPNFGLTAKCVGICQTELPSYNSARRLISHVLPIGTSLTLLCPGANLEKNVFWRRDGIRIREGADRELRVNVDIFTMLRIKQATTEESGNYTCYMDGRMKQQHIVMIREDFFIKYAGFFRHAVYLAYLLGLCLIVYIGILVIACARYHSFKLVHADHVRAWYDKSSVYADYEEAFERIRITHTDSIEES